MRFGGLLSTTSVLVAAITAIGLAIRIVIVQQSLFADELSTYWIIANHVGFGGVLDVVHSDAEITPPLYFLLAKVSTQIALTPEMLRLPSLLAGTATIPLTYLVGARTVGVRTGSVGAGLVALSPFMILYSTEARGYGLMIFLVLASTVAMLRAVDRGGLGWWVLYAACSCAAMYTHYTAAFPLAAQALWALWAHPAARRAVLLANLGAAIGFLPWISGLIADLNSPTTKVLSALEPFNLDAVRISLEHWAVGYPFAIIPLASLPGSFALLLLLLGVVLAIAALVWAWIKSSEPPRINNRLVLVLALGLSALVGEALVSLVTTNLFGTRNLAVAWPGCALLLGALLTAGRREVAVVCTGLVLVGFGIGAVKMLEPANGRPQFDAAANLIEEKTPRGDVVIEDLVLSPGPLTNLDLSLGGRYQIIRVTVPQERDHPFNVFDPVATPRQIAAQAAALSRGGRLTVLTSTNYPIFEPEVLRRLPAFHLVEAKDFEGILPLGVLILKRQRQPASSKAERSGSGAITPSSQG